SEEEIMSLISNLDLDPNDLLINSAESGFLPGVKRAIERGVDIHARDDSALQVASLYGHYAVVALLLENGADVHAHHDLSLRIASLYGRYGVVEILLDNGADVHARDDWALRYASQRGHTDVAKLLKKWMEKDEG
ncbi:MAG: ankyrin repeat domain-containing protein, partial [Nitrosopumilus sp.]